MHIIASLSNFTNYTLIGGKEIKRLEDLRGKVIGVTGAGAFSDFTIRILLKRNNLDPDKDVMLRAIGTTVVRAVALERGAIAAAPFTAEDAIRLLDKGYPLIVNLNEALRVPQSIYVTTGEMLEKYPETTKRFLKAAILGMQFAKHNKKKRSSQDTPRASQANRTSSTVPTIYLAQAGPRTFRSPTTASK